ncbi:MAG: hypothetical protein KJP04_07470 [Arenicella sp.]|nr:hypothetical protein [Arenicella sp.]
MTDILFISDNNLLIRKGREIHRSQGYAWLKDEQVFFDTDPLNNAVKHCHLAPQQIHNRYWQQCDESAIAPNAAGMRHAADLVWCHLRELQQQHSLNEVALVVPSHYQAANLKLLLGVAQASGLHVAALINAASLVVSQLATGDGIFRYLDVQLHQTVCSEVTVENGMARLTDVEVLHEISAQAMQDSLLKSMQHNFIQSDRFDPLHYAETEQQLFDQIPQAAQKIEEQGKTSLLVEHQGKLHSVNIDAKQWHAALQSQLDGLLSSAAKSAVQSFIQLNYLFDNSIPKVLQQDGVTLLVDLSQIGVPDTMPDADGELIYATEISMAASSGNKAAEVEAGVEKPRANLKNGVTHLLHAGLAIPLEQAHISTNDNQLSLSQDGQPNTQSMLDSDQVFIVNAPERKNLQTNDRLGSNLADGVITVIQVVN